MPGRQTQRGKPALGRARRILKADMKDAPRQDFERIRQKPGFRDGPTPIRS